MANEADWAQKYRVEYHCLCEPDLQIVYKNITH